MPLGGGGELTAAQPLGIQLGKALGLAANLPVHDGLLQAQQAAQAQLFPLALAGLAQGHVTHPAVRRRRLAAAGLKHLPQPLQLGSFLLRNGRLLFQAVRVDALEALYLVHDGQVAAAQQAGKQGQVQQGDKPLTRLRHGRQQCQHVTAAQQHTAQPTDEVDR
ncbi:hypothetical protein D3C85_1216630 [compost metagenome]